MNRAQVAQRKRSLILDDDGDLVYADETANGPEAFLSLRMHDCRAAGVDSVAWCMMWGIGHKGKNATRYWQTQMQGAPFQENMPDPTPVINAFCKANDIEVFGSIRMNDCHDAFGIPLGRLVYPLKVDRPEWLIGEGQCSPFREDAGLGAALWSGLDYAQEQVRADRLWWIDHTARSYDLDGVDLNFFRMPCLFKVGQEEQNLSLMTDFIRQARRLIDAASTERDSPVLLGVRVPDTVETCLRIGIDIETWLREGLVDRMLTGGGYVVYSTPAEELIKLGHRYDVPVYPCINCPDAYTRGGDNLRAAASNLWWAGADGLYLWNFQYIRTPDAPGYGRLAPLLSPQHLQEIADPVRLTYLDKSFAVNQRVWEQYQRASADPPLPMALSAHPSPVPIRIGDDVPAAHRNNRLRDVTLRLKLDGAHAGDRLAIGFNDAPSEVDITGDEWVESPLEFSAVKQGINQLDVAVASPTDAAGNDVTLEHVQVDVRYQP